MPIYKYKAVKNGSEYESTKEFADKSALYADVKREGGMIISVEEGREKASGKFNFKITSGVKADENVAFAKNLATMIEAGISMSRALVIIGKQTKNKHLL